MGDGSTLRVVDTGFGRVGGLICWENYMPLARFHIYAQGVDLWLAPTLAPGDGWIATMRHIARENRMFVIGVNPVLHADQIPAGFPHRDRLVPDQYREENGDWLDEGNTVIVAPSGEILAGPVRQREETLSPTWTSATSCPPGATSTRSAITTAPTSSAFTLIPHLDRRWLRHASPEANRRPQQEKQSRPGKPAAEGTAGVQNQAKCAPYHSPAARTARRTD